MTKREATAKAFFFLVFFKEYPSPLDSEITMTQQTDWHIPMKICQEHMAVTMIIPFDHTDRPEGHKRTEEVTSKRSVSD